jgi:hypothetical protein
MDTETWFNDWKKRHECKEPKDECDCNCDDREVVDVIHHGEFKELFEYCENCGGVII